MDTITKRYFIGAAISFFGMVSLCLTIYPSILHNYQHGISQFGAIRTTQIPFFLGFAITAAFFGLISRHLRVISRFLSAVFLVATLCLICIAVTSYPINRFMYDLHWVFVILLIFDVVVAMTWHIKKDLLPSWTDYMLAFIFMGTTIISILPIIHHIPFFRNFVLREH